MKKNFVVIGLVLFSLVTLILGFTMAQAYTPATLQVYFEATYTPPSVSITLDAGGGRFANEETTKGFDLNCDGTNVDLYPTTDNGQRTYIMKLLSISTDSTHYETPSRVGYTFNYWEYNDQEITSSTPLTFTDDITLTAHWTANSYTISYAGMDGASYGTNHPTSATYGTAFTVNNPSKASYTFLGWDITGMDSVTHTYGGSTTTSDRISGTTATSFNNLRSTSGTVTFTATWQINSVTVTLNQQSGSGGTDSVTATYGSAMPSATMPTRTGYTFGGYYTEINGGGSKYYNADGSSANNWNIASDTTLYAKWTIVSYTISYTLNGGSYGTSHPTSANYDTTFTVDRPTRSGYYFSGWTITGMDSVTHTYGDNTSTSTSLSNVRETSFKNLLSTSGTVTFTANWLKETTSGLTISSDGVLSNGRSATGDVVIPSDVTTIGASAFDFNRYVTSVIIPDGVTTIGDEAFSDCSDLTSVTIPDSVTSIGSRAFNYCSSLTSITIPDSVTRIEKWAFNSCSGLTSVIIPDSVTSIGSSAFQFCDSLTSITIPDSVTSIESWAFYGCSGLTSITIEATTPPTLSNSSEFSSTNNYPIYVPAESVDVYQAATNWSTYADRIRAIPEE